MAEVIGPLVTEVLRRVRDPQGAAITRTFALEVLGRAQQIINAFTNGALDTATVTVQPWQQIYTTVALVPQAIEVVTIQEGDRDVTQLPDWHQLGALNRAWHRQVGNRFEAWASIGRDLLVIYPAKRESSQVDITYVVAPALFGNEGESTSIRDEHVPAMLDIAEAVLQLKRRQYQNVASAVQQAALRLGVGQG